MLQRRGLAILLSIFTLIQPSLIDTARADALSAPLSLIRPSHAQSIYRHLVQNHWVPATGLFLSFVGSRDRKLSQQASTYEQGAAGLLALRFGDLGRARAIYEFLKTAWEQGPSTPGARQGIRGLVNFYNAEFGGEGIEKVIHVGPNAWAGLFVARLGNQTQDRQPLQLGLDIAYWIAHTVPHSQGGVAMGPINGEDGTPWTKIYSTENNISYYALLTELLRCPTLDAGERRWVTEERDRVENWLLNVAFDRSSYRVCRGFNPAGRDTVAALDTLTWLISALGPHKLAAKGLNPYRLMDEIQTGFVVQTPDGIGVDPTDIQEAARMLVNPEKGPSGEPMRAVQNSGRLIWYEGTNEYVNALLQMASYAEHNGRVELARTYRHAAERLLGDIDRSARSVYGTDTTYAYATPGKFFRDGWWAPAPGAHAPASSLIAATWRCFAGLGVDPLAGTDIDGIAQIPLNVDAVIVEHPTPRLLFGTSEDMVVAAWKALSQDDHALAVAQAQATIDEWSSFAMQLQQKKRGAVGDLVAYSGLPEQQKLIFGYWALNDVAAAHFIVGKASDADGDYARASKAFQQIVLHYSLAQVWDPRGWFWSPLEAVTNEYVLGYPGRYGAIIPSVLVSDYSSLGKRPN